MTISVDIEVAKRSGALIVPAASVRELNGAKPWVLKVDSALAARQPVKVGLVSAGKAEILEGLKEGDILIPPSASIKDGARVRARVVSALAP